jgi:hypothetical protein
MLVLYTSDAHFVGYIPCSIMKKTRELGLDHKNLYEGAIEDGNKAAHNRDGTADAAFILQRPEAFASGTKPNYFLS